MKFILNACILGYMTSNAQIFATEIFPRFPVQAFQENQHANLLFVSVIRMIHAKNATAIIMKDHKIHVLMMIKLLILEQSHNVIMILSLKKSTWIKNATLKLDLLISKVVFAIKLKSKVLIMFTLNIQWKIPKIKTFYLQSFEQILKISFILLQRIKIFLKN